MAGSIANRPTRLTFHLQIDIAQKGQDEKKRVVLFCFAFLEERESVEMPGRIKNGLVSTFPFLYVSNAEKPITTKASQIKFSAEIGLSETLLGLGYTL